MPAAHGKRVRYPAARSPLSVTIIERFLSEQTLWLSCIDRLIAFLRVQDGEWGRLLTLANGIVPGGPRFDACLDSTMDSDPPAGCRAAPGRKTPGGSCGLPHRNAEPLVLPDPLRRIPGCRKNSRGLFWEELAANMGQEDKACLLMLLVTIPFP
jgi:hypothetical protein